MCIRLVRPSSSRTGKGPHLMGRVEEILRNAKAPEFVAPRFAPRDGLGLYISRGLASFRNVVVEPIADEE